MNDWNEKEDAIAQELYEEQREKYNDILKEKTVLDFLQAVDYEVNENERNSVLKMTINEFLKDWASDGLF